MRTIIQDFPTIYGETVNGSVYGQPNGSIARPPQNTAASITLSGTVTVKVTGTQDSVVYYDIIGMTAELALNGAVAKVGVTVENASDNTVCGATGNFVNGIPSPLTGLAGVNVYEPTDGDTLTVIVIAKDSDGNVVTKATITATAEVPA